MSCFPWHHRKTEFKSLNVIDEAYGLGANGAFWNFNNVYLPQIFYLKFLNVVLEEVGSLRKWAVPGYFIKQAAGLVQSYGSYTG